MLSFFARALSDIQYKRDARRREREGTAFYNNHEYSGQENYTSDGGYDYYEEEANPHLLRIEYKPEQPL